MNTRAPQQVLELRGRKVVDVGCGQLWSAVVLGMLANKERKTTKQKLISSFSLIYIRKWRASDY